MPLERQPARRTLGRLHVEAAERLIKWRSFGQAALVVSVLLFMFSYTHADGDLWGHVKFGQDLWRTGDFTRPDTYSYLSGPWLNHELLAEAAFALTFDIAGATGLIVLKVILSLLVVGLAYRHLRLRDLAPLYAWMLLLVASLLLQIGIRTLRPQIFTYLFFLLLLLVIYQADRGDRRWLWVLPPLFALWVNTHGGFLAGMAIFLLWALAYLVTCTLNTRQLASLLRPPSRTVTLVAIASMAATLLNPYGIRLILFLLRTASVPRPLITEWEPLALMSFEGVIYVGMVMLGLAGFIFSRRDKSAALLFLWFVMVLLPLTAVRHAPLFALATLVLTGEHIADALQQLSSSMRKGEGARQSMRWEPWLIGLFILISAGFAIASIPRFACIHVLPSMVPQRAVALLDSSGISGNMAVFFNWGEFAIWYLGPDVQVSMDGRRETVYSPEVYAKNASLTFGVLDWDAVLTDYDTELALVEKDGPAHNLLKLKPGWVIEYEDDISILAVKDDSPLLERIRAAKASLATQSTGLCFP